MAVLRAFVVSALLAVQGVVAEVPYSSYILAPSDRTLYGASLYAVNGTVNGASSLVGSSPGSAVFTPNSAITLDMGKNIAGVVSITVANSSGSDPIGITFTESKMWINGLASDGTGSSGLDAVYDLDVSGGAGTYTVERQKERGGFRYLNLIWNGSASIEVTQVSVYFTPVPHFSNPTDYTGYFHCNDEKLNLVWYAGTYEARDRFPPLTFYRCLHGSTLYHRSHSRRRSGSSGQWRRLSSHQRMVSEHDHHQRYQLPR